MMSDAAVSYIGDHAQQANPFFLYYALSAPHHPIFPPDFLIGSTGTNAYGDFIGAVDWAVGRVLDALSDPNHDGNHDDSVLDNTLVVFSADNGAETDYSFSTSTGFVSSQKLRGDKATIYEGGNRIPLMMQWNGRIPAGTAASNMTELNDFMATTADLLGYALPWNSAPDSYSMKGVLLGQSGSPTRTTGVETSNGGAYSLRQIDDQGNEWKLIFTSGDGQSVGGIDPLSTITNFNSLQLYNLTTDPGERTNLLAGGGAATMQQRALAMQSVVRGYILNGRSTPAPGLAQSADYRQQNVFRVDFGLSTQTTPGTGWNNVAGAAGDETVVDMPLANSLGQDTGIRLRTVWSSVSSDDSGINAAAANFNGPYPYELDGLPQSALQDGVYVRDGQTLSITLQGLRVGYVYDFLFYGAAANSGEFSLFTVTGANSDQKGIAPLINNSTTVAWINGIVADASNQILIEFEGRRPNGATQLPGVNDDGMGRLNFLQIIERWNLPGDYNRDGFVDTQDYQVWLDGFGSTSDLSADGNGDGIVDASDYTVWRDHFGSGSLAAGAGATASPFTDHNSWTAVPECNSLRLLALGLMGESVGYRGLRRRPIYVRAWPC